MEEFKWDEELKKLIEALKKKLNREKETGLLFSKDDNFDLCKVYCVKCYEYCDVYSETSLSECCKSDFFPVFEDITKEERKRQVKRDYKKKINKE